MTEFLGRVKSRVFPDRPAKSLYLCSVESLETLPDAMSPASENFGLVISMDASNVSNELIFRAAEKLIAKGIVYLCAWGPECERVHDDFDEANIFNERHIMTTWHANQTLEVAIGFFADCAFPEEQFGAKCEQWIIACVGNPEWEQIVRAD